MNNRMELSIVIGLLIVLSVLLGGATFIPAHVVCANNLKQQHLALGSYLSLHEDYFPPAYQSNTGKYWFQHLAEQMTPVPALWNTTPEKSPGPFSCPAVKGYYRPFAVNYAYNTNLFESKASVGQMKMLQTPSEALLITDARIVDESSDPPTTFYCFSHLSIYLPNRGMIPPGFTAHDGKTQALFADGHVELCSPEQIFKNNIRPNWK